MEILIQSTDMQKLVEQFLIAIMNATDLNGKKIIWIWPNNVHPTDLKKHAEKVHDILIKSFNKCLHRGYSIKKGDIF